MSGIQLALETTEEAAASVVHSLACECFYKPGHRRHRNDPLLTKEGAGPKGSRTHWSEVYRAAFPVATVAAQLRAGADPILEMLQFAWDYLWMPRKKDPKDPYGLHSQDLEAETTLNARVALAFALLGPHGRTSLLTTLTGGQWSGGPLHRIAGSLAGSNSEPEGVFVDTDRPSCITYEMKIDETHSAKQFVKYLNCHSIIENKLALKAPICREHLAFFSRTPKALFSGSRGWVHNEGFGYRARRVTPALLVGGDKRQPNWEAVANEISISVFFYDDLLAAFDRSGFDPLRWEHQAARVQLVRTVRYAGRVTERPDWSALPLEWRPRQLG